MADKLYVVTRADLPPGSQAVQSMHASRQYAHEHPEIERRWFEESNHLCMLSVRDERALEALIQKAARTGVTFAVFREPDLGDSITAAAFEPGARGQRLCSGLQLALRSESQPAPA